MLAGCLGAPRSGSEIAHTDAPLQFEGFVERQEAPVRVEAYDYGARRWRPIAEIAPSGFEPIRDPLGQTRHRFAASVRLPEDADLWAPAAGRGPMKALLRARQAGHVLTSFDQRADDCLRNAHARALMQSPGAQAIESALRMCRGGSSPAVEVYVGACGELGQSCCAHHGASEQARCAPELSCDAARCRSPEYPAPWVPGHQVDLALAEHEHLSEAWLELDDRSVGSDTRVALIAGGRAAAGVELMRPQPDVLRLRFDVALWKPGMNRFRVRAIARLAEAIDGSGKKAPAREVVGPYQRFDYVLPERFGHLAPGRFRLPARHFPMRIDDCGAGCKDSDGDGLNDLWENVALHQLRPRLMMPKDERLLSSQRARRGDARDAVRVISSVTASERAGGPHVQFMHVVAFSRDYGPPGITRALGLDHPGDTEAWGISFRVQPDGELHHVASLAKGHDCLTCKPSWRWDTQEFGADGAPQVYVERDKHGLWQSGRLCRRESGFECADERSLRPEAVNAGDWRPAGPVALLDALSGLSPEGPHGALAGIFPGDAVWTPTRARVVGRFCGGQADGCSRRNSANLPGDVLRDLAQRFERRGL